MKWREMCIQNELTYAISVHRKEEIENRAKLRKIEKCKMTEWVRLLGMLGHQEPRLFTHSRQLWRYKIEEMSVKTVYI